MEAVYKKMLGVNLESLNNSSKGSIDGGQIYFLDKIVDMSIFAQRNENDEIKKFYVAFDQPKK